MPKEAQSLLPSDVPDRAIILERLHRVLDPELDEPVLQLGFIKSLHVQGGHATVAMHMPMPGPITPAAQRFMAHRAGSTTVEIDSSHVSMISHPGAVADLIETAANATADG